MRFQSLVSGALIAALVSAPAAALPRPKASAAHAPETRIERMLPGDTSAAVFLNVKRLYALYGDLITSQPDYAKLREAVAKGLPDPEKEIDTIGIVSNLESSKKSAVGAVVLGKLDLPRLLKAVETEGHMKWTESMIRGVKFFSASEGVELGQADDHTTIVSYDPSNAHPHAKSIVATLAGGAPSFGATNKLTLPAGWLLNGSMQVPADLRTQAAALGPQFEPVTHITFISLSVSANDAKDGKVILKIACDSKDPAQQLKGLLMGLSGAVTSGQSAGAADLLNKIKLTVSGTALTLALDLPKSEIENAIHAH